MSIGSVGDRFLPRLEEEMQTVVTAPTPDLYDLYGYLRYHLGWTDGQFQPVEGHTGKRLRPLLCLLVCQACGGDWEQALPAAAAVELLHNFSLIHDDIEDGDTTRRGHPTLWTLVGLPQAINAGDTLFALAHAAIIRLQDRQVPPETVATAMSLLVTACVRLTEGQFLDIRFESQPMTLPEAYLQMVEGKTAALLAASCELGALVAAAPKSQRGHLRTFGRRLGLAFQIQDDVLGIWGDPQITGKPAGSDLLHRKKTLPIIRALKESAPLRAVLENENLDHDDLPQAIALLEATGSKEWTRRQANEQTRLALAALDAAAVTGPAADALRDVTESLMDRTR